MDNPRPTTHAEPNLWHFFALAWGTSNMLFSMFIWPISMSHTGVKLQICMLVAHLGGVLYLWHLGAKRGNPKRLLVTALVTTFFVYIAPIWMLAAPVMVLAAYALPGSWRTVATIFVASALALSLLRIVIAATDREIGNRFDPWLIGQLDGSVISTPGISVLFTRIGKRATEPTKVDGWSMIAAVATGLPILSANIEYNTTSRIMGLIALGTTPLAMHALSRLAVHSYLWIYRLRRFERESGIRVILSIRRR